MDTVRSLLGVLCAHPPASECFAANGLSLPPSDGIPWTLDPLSHAGNRDSYPQVLHPHCHNPKPGTDGHGRLSASRGARSWGVIYTPTPLLESMWGLSPKIPPLLVPCLSPSCILHTLTGCFWEGYFNQSFILKSLMQGLLLGEPTPRQ